VISEERRKVKAPLQFDKQFPWWRPKGAASSVRLFRNRAIADHLICHCHPGSKQPLVRSRHRSLSGSPPVRRVLLGAHGARRPPDQRLSELRLASQAPPRWRPENLKNHRSARARGNSPAGDIYGKVLESVADTPGSRRRNLVTRHLARVQDQAKRHRLEACGLFVHRILTVALRDGLAGVSAAPLPSSRQRMRKGGTRIPARSCAN